MTIPFFRTEEDLLRRGGDLDSELDLLFESCELTHGEFSIRLEEALKSYTGAKHVIAVGNATDALSISLLSIGVGAGDEVIVPSYSFFATASSVRHTDAIPVFVDINPRSYAINPNEIEKRISKRTKAIMPVHLFSQTAPMGEIKKIANKHNLRIVEDSAEAIGMYCEGTHAGLLSDVGVLSFFPTKTLGAFGDAGAIITNDSEIAERCSRLRTHGYDRSGKSEVKVLGFNSKIDGVQCAVLLARLKRLENEIKERKKLASLYTERLKVIHNFIKTPKIVQASSDSREVFYVYLVEAIDRDELREHLNQNGVGTEVYYPIPLHLQPCFSDLGYSLGDMPVAEAASKSALALPLFAGLKESEVELVCELIKDFYERRNN